MKRTRDESGIVQNDERRLSWKDIEKEGWHRNAPHYDTRAGRMTINAVRPLLKAVKARPGMRLLDVCCGPGYGAGLAAADGLTATGIDLAPAMVQEAQRRFSTAEIREGDAENLDFPSASFDAVICAFGLLHLSDPARAFTEAFRVLARGGRYAFTVWSPPDKARLLALALNALTAHADMTVSLPVAPPMFQFSDPAVARAALEQAGFTAVDMEDIPIEFVGRTSQDVFDWLDKSTVRTMAVFRLQTAAVQERIREEILRGAQEHLLGNEVRIPCPALLFSAQKP